MKRIVRRILYSANIVMVVLIKHIVNVEIFPQTQCVYQDPIRLVVKTIRVTVMLRINSRLLISTIEA